MDVVLRLRIPAKLRDALARAADAEGVSDSEFVRQVLEDRLRRR